MQKQIIDNQGGVENCAVPFKQKYAFGFEIFTIKFTGKNSGYEYAEVLKSIFNKDVNIVDKTYDRAINQELPGGLKAYGVEEVKTFLVKNQINLLTQMKLLQWVLLFRQVFYKVM